MKIPEKLLIVAAHPDDEVLMCGGTAKRLSLEGTEIQTLILGEGITSRDGWKQSELDELHKNVEKANLLIGSKKTYLKDFPDNKFDSVPLLNIVKEVSKVKNSFAPDMIITHYRNDLNIDHRKTYEAVITATRPMIDETVKTILSGEVISSTEWQVPYTFSPTVFYDVHDTIETKIEAMKIYKSEVKSFPHQRSLYSILLTAQHWGMVIGCQQAEAFEAVRMII